MLLSVRSMLFPFMTYLAGSLFAARPAAAETPYCEQARARAASDAALLMSPRLLVTALRFPRGSQLLDAGPVTSDGFQLRTGFAFSPVDFYKGETTLRIGEADCARHAALMDLDVVLTRGTSDARWAALEQQGQYLKARSEEWRALRDRAAERLSQRVITVVEFTNVQRFIDNLEHKLVQVEGDAQQLAATRPLGSTRPGLPGTAQSPVPKAPGAPLPSSAPSVPALASRYFDSESRFEREASALRRFDAWRLQVTGGVVPQTPVDWYGAIELSFNLGGLIRSAHEEQYLDAKSRALAAGTDGVDAKLEQLRAEAAAVLGRARRDLDLVRHSLEVIRATRSALETSEADSVAHARDMLAIEQMSIESDSVFLNALVTALESLVARARG